MAIMTAANATAQDPRVVILLAHPDMEASTANKTMMEKAIGIEGVKVVDIYREEFSVEFYTRELSAAETIVMQFPMYWLSSPAGLKRWQDDILTNITDVVAGKNLMVATTTGSPDTAYRSGGANRFTIDELLRPFEATARHAGMNWLTPFAIHSAGDPGSVAAGAEAYRQILERLSGKRTRKYRLLRTGHVPVFLLHTPEHNRERKWPK